MAAVTKVGINHCYLTVTGTVISMGVINVPSKFIGMIGQANANE